MVVVSAVEWSAFDIIMFIVVCYTDPYYLPVLHINSCVLWAKAAIQAECFPVYYVPYEAAFSLVGSG